MMLSNDDDSNADDIILSRQLLQLSSLERNAINEEIHGVRCLAVHETPVLLEESLQKFNQELLLIPKSKAFAYHKIFQHLQASRLEQLVTLNQTGSYGDDHELSYTFVVDTTFRLRFLRAELFDAKKAAIRFVNYLNLSNELFGDVALKRQIRLSDFERGDMKFLRKGYMQILPYRDRAGRRVLVGLGGMNSDVDAIERAKAFFYTRDVLTRDSVESQQKGAVFVSDVITWERIDYKFSTKSFELTRKIIAAVPTRMVAIHNCFPDQPKFRLFNFLPIIQGPFYVSRIRNQIGTKQETRYNLKGYGIPIHLLPLTGTDGIKLKQYHEWLRLRKLLEESSQESRVALKLDLVVECPGSNDVVFRQGTPSMKNLGNIAFRNLMIARLADHYLDHEEDKNEHMQPEDIDEFCVSTIHDIETTRGGRFLEWDKGLNAWIRMEDPDRVKSKVMVSFRDLTKRYLARKANTQNDSSVSVAFVKESNDRKRRCCRHRNDSNYNEW